MCVNDGNGLDLPMSGAQITAHQYNRFIICYSRERREQTNWV